MEILRLILFSWCRSFELNVLQVAGHHCEAAGSSRGRRAVGGSARGAPRTGPLVSGHAHCQFISIPPSTVTIGHDQVSFGGATEPLVEDTGQQRPMEGLGGNISFFPFAELLGVEVCALPRTCGTAAWIPLEDVHQSPATGLSAVSSGATRPRVSPACAGKAGACFEDSLCRSGRGHGQATGIPARAPGGGGAALLCSSGVQ